MKNKVSVCVVGLLTVIALIFALLSVSVYGRIDLVSALRSRFMVEVLVPILTSTITFGGIAITIFVTSSHHKDDKKHERDMLASEFIGKSRSKWLSEFREAYSALDYAITDFCVDAMSYNPDIQEGKRISEDVYNRLKTKALFINKKSKNVRVFLNPIRKELRNTNSQDDDVLLGVETKLGDDLEKLVNTSLGEIKKMASIDPRKFSASVIFELESECNQAFTVITKTTWECIKRDVNYSPKKEGKEIMYASKQKTFREFNYEINES